MSNVSPPSPQSLHGWSLRTTKNDQLRALRGRRLDRWIDVLAQLYGVPRVVMLRQLRVMPHLEGAIARLLANYRDDTPAMVVTGYSAEPGHRRTEQTDRETDDFLAQLRAAKPEEQTA